MALLSVDFRLVENLFKMIVEGVLTCGLGGVGTLGNVSALETGEMLREVPALPLWH